MGKYIKTFEYHDDYSDFINTNDFIKPNVSHCINENEVHYNPLLPSGTLYRGNDIIAQREIYYNETDNFYDRIFLTNTTSDTITYDRITLNLYKGAQDVTVTNDNSDISFDYSMNGNILSIYISNGERTGTYDLFTMSYKNINNESREMSIIIHANVPA